ncbi:MAG: NADH:flavin oxidoreductase, partial [Fusobacterium sp. JB021]|nr:NADH:flavin oxidoreductase [Fusobacterium sp. JB021]
DEYGGSIENRSRIIVEIVKNVRDAVGEEFPIMIKLNSEDFMDNGLTSDESIIVSKILEKSGIDAIEISGGNESSLKVANENLGPARTKVSLGKDKESYFSKHAARLAKKVNIPIILTGGNRHFDIIENIAKETKISYFALSRPLICEPDLINKWEDGELKKPKCISCNQCYHTYGKRCIFNVK